MKANENGIPRVASPAQLWRLNQLRLLSLNDAPTGRPLLAPEMKEALAEAVRLRLWTPTPHKPRGTVRSGA